MKPSEPIAAMPRSGIREVMELAGAIDGAIHLETGEPNFNTPRHICEAAAQAAFDGFTKYTPNAGIPPLREALAAKVRERNGIDATADQVVVTSGAVAGIYSSMVSLVDPGAEMRDAYRHRRDLVTEFLSGRGIPHVRPRGAFYLMVDVSGSGSSGMDFVLRLLKEKQVAVVPGDTFGPGSGRFVRVSLATAPDLLMEGVQRLADDVEDWGS